MALLSKPTGSSLEFARNAAEQLLTRKLNYTCYELGHTWTPSCTEAALGVMGHTAATSAKMYATLYLVMAVAQKKKKMQYFKKSFWIDVLRSTAFLSVNVGAFIAAFCLWRRMAGHFNIASTFIPAFAASLSAIFIERTHRRSMLALYMTNLALDTFYRMLTSRGILRPVKYGEVALFCMALAGYLYLYRKPNGLDRSSQTAIRMLFGSAECGAEQQDGGSDAIDGTRSRAVTEGRWARRCQAVFATAGQLLERALAACHINGRHSLCHHQHGCIYTSLTVAFRGAGIGFAIQAALGLIPALRKHLKSPSKLLSSWLLQQDNVSCGTFVGGMCLIYQSVNCLLRTIRNKDSAVHGLVAGFLSGLAMASYRSSDLALYVVLRLSGVLVNKSVEARVLPDMHYGVVLLYAVSTAILLHAIVWEPHNVRPGYWKFMLRITGGRFGEMNRKLMDPFGCQSSKIFGDWWPKYDARHTPLVQTF